MKKPYFSLLTNFLFFVVFTYSCDKNSETIISEEVNSSLNNKNGSIEENITTPSDNFITPQKEELDLKGIYISGLLHPKTYNNSEYPSSVVWEEGILNPFNCSYNGGSSNVCILNDDVYVSGYNGPTPSLWVNGIETQFIKIEGARSGKINDMCIYNDELYHVTTYFNGIRSILQTWKNKGDSLEILDIDPRGGNQAYGIHVANDTVYVAGYSNYSNATIWKNKTMVTLSGGQNVYDICNIGTDIYAIGHYLKNGRSFPTIWKNGKMMDNYLELDNINAGKIVKIINVGDDIYIAGSVINTTHSLGKFEGVVWKNGKIQYLTDASNPSTIYGLYVKDEEVYVTCYMYYEATKLYPTVRKNGESYKIGNYPGIATSIFVKDVNNISTGLPKLR